ncbi:MAG: bifunctional phosphoribosylaminoimidazolecarboxamide formyltransferase/IMP cyclohydrolase [Pirellulales bacterium]
MESPIVKRALISVSDKSELAEFARGLAALEVELYSTGGTARFLSECGLKVVEVSDYTQFPEMMHGRLKTLHPKIFGGILWRQDEPEDRQALADHGIAAFDLVVVNLYPFEATVARADATPELVIENIDIGGPSLVRAAAKNHRFVTIATDPRQYAGILAELQSGGSTTMATRERLAAEAFARTASYDAAISSYFSGRVYDEPFPPSWTISMKRQEILRYGENPHQQAAVYRTSNARGANLLDAQQLNGKELSYNNLLDLDAALAIARDFQQPAAAVIKHTNPCGAAIGQTLLEACQRAMAGDPVSAFGSILAFNRPVDEATARYLATPGLFIEAIVAPEFTPAGLQILTTEPKWRANVRLLQVGSMEVPAAPFAFRNIEGGMLVQTSDFVPEDQSSWQVVTTTQPTDAQRAELAFAWTIVKHVKSNAIAVTRDRSLCGAGAGQMSRVDSVEISLSKAGDRARGAVLASDAFFPFPDSIHRAAEAGIAAIIQPGGSKRDDEVIAACNERQLPMIFTGRRHFRH